MCRPYSALGGPTMSSKFSENVEAQIVGTIIGGAILLAPAAIFAGAAPLLTATLGDWATYLAELLLGAATLLFSVVAGHYYFFVLPAGREPARSLERKRYDDFTSRSRQGRYGGTHICRRFDENAPRCRRVFWRRRQHHPPFSSARLRVAACATIMDGTRF